MKISILKNSVIAFAISLVMVSCGSGGSNQQSESAAPAETKKEQLSSNSLVVKIVAIDAYSFNQERGTVRLDVQFDNPVNGLRERDVKVSVGSISLVQCSTGDTKFWRVDIEGLAKSATQEVTISFNKDEYNFEPKSNKLTIE